MTEHTKGPWKFFSNGIAIGVEAGYSDVAWTRFDELALRDTARSPEEDEANAHLISAAPELLSCLQEMVDITEEECRLDHHGYCQAHYLDDVNDGGCRVANAKAAIAKARGETK